MRTDDLHIEYHAGKYQVVRTSNGIDGRVNVGPRFGMPREASAYIATLSDVPEVSPLRSRAADESPSTGGDMTPRQHEADRMDPRDRLTESALSTAGFTPATPGLWDLPEQGGGR